MQYKYYEFPQNTASEALDENGRTPLHRAVIEGYLTLVEYYVQKGAPLNSFDFYGTSPFELAEDDKIKQYLLDNGASPLQSTELHHAVFNGNLNEIKELLDKNPDLLNALDHRGQTALHYAVLDDRLDIVEALLERGADLNILDRAGYPAVYYALPEGSEVKTFLMQHGAVDFDKSECPPDLNYTDLHWAAASNDLRAIKKILSKNKAIINNITRNGDSPLALALLYGNFSAATLLVTEGADVNIMDRTWQTPLHQAVLIREFGLIKTLVEHGVIIDAPDRYGITPLHLAAEMKYAEIVHFLLENNANPELTDYLQENIIEKSKEETEEPGIKRDTVLSKMFKRRIGLDKNYLEKVSLAFEQMLKEQMMAKSPAKKILVLLAETHGVYKIHQLEKSLLKGVHAAGLSCLCIEFPQDGSGYVTDKIAQIAKDKYTMRVEPVDVHPQRDSVSVFERNIVIRDEIVAQNQDAVFITGIDHLQSLLEEGDAQIPTSRFHVIPINLASIIQSQVFKSPEAVFASNSSKVIQLFLNNEKCFTKIDPVTDYWNGSSSIICTPQNNEVENQLVSPAQNFKIADVQNELETQVITEPQKVPLAPFATFFNSREKGGEAEIKPVGDHDFSK